MVASITSNALAASSWGELPPKRVLIPSSVLGTTIFVLTEAMFFTALISAYMVIRAGAGSWAPPEAVRLPVVATLLNTAVLLLSGVLMWLSARNFSKDAKSNAAQRQFILSMLLGMCFVSLQGYEWYHLLKVGMSMTSGVFSACFFLLIGSHAAHAISAIIAMLFITTMMLRGTLRSDRLWSMCVYWTLIVGVWPFLFGLVYF